MSDKLHFFILIALLIASLTLLWLANAMAGSVTIGG
jgi:hypothetical protein